MKFEILYGRAGSGKTHECIERIKELIAAGERCIMLVPEQFSYRTEKLLVNMLGYMGSQSAEALTFTRLAGRIFAHKSGAVKPALSAAGKNILIYRCILSVKNELVMYSRAAERVGFVDRICTLISEFKRYGISAEDIRALSEKMSNATLRAKLCDIALIYDKYDELFLDDYCDFEDNLYLAADMLEDSGVLDGVHIFIDEFSDFLPQHYKMLEAMGACAKSMTLCLCIDKNISSYGTFAPAAKTFAKIKKLCAEIGASFESVYFGENHLHAGNESLLHLEKNYSKIRPEQYIQEPESIKIFESLSVYSEIENAARSIAKLAREDGVRWRDIVLCCGDSESYFEAVKIIFSRYDIPCFISEKTPVSSHPIVLTILSAIDIFINSFSYESVFSYLKTGFSNILPDEVDILENYVLATGANKRAWLDEKPWSYKSELTEEESEINEQIDEIRRRVILPLMKLRENIGSKHTATHSCEAVYAFMCELDMATKVQEMIDKFKDEGDFVNANRYSRIWNSVMDILDQIVLVAGNKKIGMQQFRNLLETGFVKEQMGIIPQSADAVAVVDVSNARAQSCDYMFALGTNTGAFMGAGTAEGVLSDSEREMMEEAGVQIAPTAREASFDADFLIYKAITRPSKQLYLSYAVSKMTGESLPESELCRTVKKIFANITINSDISGFGSREELLSGMGATFGAMAENLKNNESNADGFWTQVMEWYKSHEKYKFKAAALEAALAYSSEAKNLTKEQTDKLYPDGFTSSVSRLEKYSKCPFSYFIEYTLKAKERKVLKIGAPDIGSIMHAVLERFTKLIGSENLRYSDVDEKYIDAAISAIIDEMGEKMFSGSMLAGKMTQYMFLRLKRNLIRCAKLIVMHIASGRFEPVGSEVYFGDGGKINAVVVDLTSGKKLKIHGVIDRVDSCTTNDGTYYRIVDYKSGNKTFSLEGIYNKLDLQLVVYLDAAMQSKKDAKPAGMLYFNIREPMINATSKMEEQAAADAVEKEMKLNGLVLSDPEVIRDMDPDFEKGSAFLPVTMNKSGDIRITQSVATMNQFNVLIKYVKSSLKQIGDSISSGKIDINPYMSSSGSVCSYCAYKSVCKFDTDKKGNKYRMCQKLKAAEAWEMFNEGGR